MTGSRWKHRIETVTVGENSQRVRGLTAGECNQYIELNKKAKAGEISPMQMAQKVVAMACVEPTMSEQEVADMPGELFAAVTQKVLELAGYSGDEEKKTDPLSVN
jgi:hypothetical protein